MDKEKIWDIIGYTNLALCIIGQITVGYFYLLAQTTYLIANGIGVIRSFALKRPVADKMKDIVFFAITIALIILKLI